MKARLTRDGFSKRLKTLIKTRDEMEKNVNDLHVRLQRGNKKTGINCFTVSLLPIIDCCNCKECKHDCYDMNNDMRYPSVIKDRAKNSVIHKLDKERYWNEIDIQIKANFIRELRLNVGGDLDYEDLFFVAEIGRNNPKTKVLFFTKNYDGINKFLEENAFPENVHPILSAWKGVKIDNPHNIPCSHVLYEDGSTTAPSYGAYYCTGNCSECSFNEEGCWTLKNGEHVIFHVH